MNNDDKKFTASYAVAIGLGLCAIGVFLIGTPQGQKLVINSAEQLNSIVRKDKIVKKDYEI